MKHATWTCVCGSVEAELPSAGNHLVCYCESCRGFVEQLGKGDRLDAAGGSALFQVSPDQVRFTKGAEHLRWMKLSPKGPMRWYTACCNTPMANTLANRAIAFASFQVHDIAPQDALAEVSARVHLKGALAHVEGRTGGIGPLLASLLGRSAKSWVTGAWKRNPFFDASGTPIGPREDPVPSSG
ncbi:MAG: DUF6151 family protein [Pseudomonadota bacterium]